MPRADQSADVDMSSFQQMPPNAAVPNLLPPPSAETTRSRVMIASLPGIGSGPDAILRQFNGGRQVPKRRIFTP